MKYEEIIKPLLKRLWLLNLDNDKYLITKIKSSENVIKTNLFHDNQVPLDKYLRMAQ